MANAISTDPTAAVAASTPVAARKIAPGAGAAFAATVATVATATPQADATAPAPAPIPAPASSFSVELSPAAHFLSTVAHAQEQLSQLEASAIDSATLQRAVDALSAPAAQPDEPAQLNTNPALAAAIAAYRLSESPASHGNARSNSSKRNLVSPVDALTPEDALESETDASLLKAQQHAPLR